MATATVPRLKADDLFRMPDWKRFELVDGQLVERAMGMKSNFIAGNIHTRLNLHCIDSGVGVALPEASYQCFAEDGEKVRIPDVSFVSRKRIPPTGLPDGHARFAPDLAVEVISPNEDYQKLDAKVLEYFAAGVRLVWVVTPPTQTVMIRRADGSAMVLRANNDITGEDVIPGFQCRVAEFFIDPLAPPQS